MLFTTVDLDLIRSGKVCAQSFAHDGVCGFARITSVTIHVILSCFRLFLRQIFIRNLHSRQGTPRRLLAG